MTSINEYDTPLRCLYYSMIANSRVKEAASSSISKMVDSLLKSVFLDIENRTEKPLSDDFKKRVKDNVGTELNDIITLFYTNQMVAIYQKCLSDFDDLELVTLALNPKADLFTSLTHQKFHLREKLFFPLDKKNSLTQFLSLVGKEFISQKKNQINQMLVSSK